MRNHLKIYDRVYFGRGPFEFVGVVIGILPNSVFVEGVETGCCIKKTETTQIEYLCGLRVLDEVEWAQAISNEPAFAHTMSKEKYINLQQELEQLELSIAMGQDHDMTDYRIGEIKMMMEYSPWVMHPSYGCVDKKVVYE